MLKSPRQKINGESYETKCSFVDAKSLFEWAFDSLKYTTLVSENEVVGEIAVENGKDADTVRLVAKENANVIVPAGLDKSAVIYKFVDKPESLEAPVTKGQDVCSAQVIYGEQVVAQVELVAAESVELSTFLKVINAVKHFFSLTAVKVIILIVVGAVLCYGVTVIVAANKKKKRRRRRSEEYERQENNGNDDFLPPPMPPRNR